MKPKIWGLIGILVGLFFTTMVWGQVELPEEIKKIVPIYKGAKVLQTFQFQDGTQAILEVKASPKEVIIFYKDSMQKKGWTVVMEMNMQDNAMLNLTKDDTTLVINSNSDQKGKTMVQLVLQRKK